ncbi:phosphopantetheine-binding protein, partial [Flavitalea flava]
QDLSAIWGELLGIGRIGMNDNFFELGGDSIITIQVVSRARRMGYELQPKDIFSYQSIGSLSAALLTRSAGQAGHCGEQGLLTGPSGLLPVQSAYLSGVVGAEGAGSHFNQSVLLGIDKGVEAGELEGAVGQLLSYHDALRFRYRRVCGDWVQEYGGEQEGVRTAFRVEEMDQYGQGEWEGVLRDRGQYYQESLNIEQGELMRVVLFRT